MLADCPEEFLCPISKSVVFYLPILPFLCNVIKSPSVPPTGVVFRLPPEIAAGRRGFPPATEMQDL